MPYVEGAYKPRSGARTPMQWAPGKNLGFSTAPTNRLYLPVDPAPDAPTVKSQETDPQSLLHHVRQLIHLRKSRPALAGYAEFVPVLAKENTYPLAFARAADGEVLLAIFNPSERAETAKFRLNIDSPAFELLAGDPMIHSCRETEYVVEVPGVSYAIYKLK
jgi:maltose alpha-D-glucosyltransferase/alpha-amylase